MLTFAEGAVGDALQEFSVVGERADMAPMDLVGMDVEMLIAEGLKAASDVSISALRCIKALRAWSLFWRRGIVISGLDGDIQALLSPRAKQISVSSD